MPQLACLDGVTVLVEGILEGDDLAGGEVPPPLDQQQALVMGQQLKAITISNEMETFIVSQVRDFH